VLTTQAFVGRSVLTEMGSVLTTQVNGDGKQKSINKVKTLFDCCYWGGGRDRGSTFGLVLKRDNRSAWN